MKQPNINLYYNIIEKIFKLEYITFEDLKVVPEFEACIGSPENQKWHFEGTTDKHIQLVIDAVYKFINEHPNLPKNYKIALYMTAIFHDFRKPQCLEKDAEGIYHNPNHEQEASRLLFDFIKKSEYVKDLYDKNIVILASKMILWHMLKSPRKWYGVNFGYLVGCFEINELELLINFHRLDDSGQINDQPKISDDDLYDNISLAVQKKYQHFNYYPERNDIKLWVLVGPPGCGKSTYAEKLVKEHENTVIVSTDDIRKEIFNSEEIQKKGKKGGSTIWGEAYQRMENLLSFEKKNVIFNATCINYQMRQNLISKAQKRKIPIHIIYFLTDLETCLKNNKSRKRQVPEDILISIYKNIQIPSYLEGNIIEFIDF
jgi:predicted kinase